MRDRVAVIFMTLSVVATLVLGGAIIHDLDRNTSTTTQVLASPGVAAPGQEQSPSAGAAGATPGATGAQVSGGTAGSAGTAGTAGHVVGGAPAGTPGQLSTNAAASPGGLITVGGIYDETGPFDATVERDTVRSYFDTVNAAGGVNGYKFQLIDCDSGYDPSTAHQCSQRLLSQNVLAIVGWLSVSGEQPETPYLASQGVPIVGGLGVPSEFQSALSYPVSADLRVTGTAIGTHAKDLGIHAPGLVLLNVNFIKPVEQTLLAALHAQGIKEKSLDEVDPTKADYTDEAIKLRSEGVDSIIALLDPFSYARFFQALDRQDFHPKFYGGGLDKKSAEQQYGPAVYNAESLTPLLEPDEHQNVPAMAAYYGAVRRYFPNQVQALDVYSEGDWVAAVTFVQAIRSLGSTPVSRKSLVDALNHLTNFDDGLTEPLSFAPGPSHASNHCFQWIQNRSGTWHTYSGWNCF